MSSLPSVTVSCAQAAITYPVYFRPYTHLPALLLRHGLSSGPCLIITDTHVAHHYLQGVTAVLEDAGWLPMPIVLPPGESTKSLSHLSAVYDAALAHPLTRETPLLALGGGVIGDLAGFAAATLLRGLPLVQIPTTLLAQVDSAIGGKTGINHPAGKNLIGAFHQPLFVLSDTGMLRTLPRREWFSGLAEVVKSALLGDATLFDDLTRVWDDLQPEATSLITAIAHRTAAIKADVVSRDEREQGIRAHLNLGHTFGHALERATAYAHFTHGEAVVVGLRAAAFLSARYHADLPLDAILHLLDRFPLPPFPEGLQDEDLLQAMATDKKRRQEGLRLVLLSRIGQAYVTDKVPESDILDAWAFARKYPACGA